MKRRVAKHGTTTRYYTLKCRCSKCRKAAREYMRDLRAKLRAPEAKIPHGTVNGYENYSCRCERCTKAKMKSKKIARKRAVAAA
jgi:thymidine kinase